MIKLVGYLFMLVTFSVHALVPVEGILMGEAPTDIQNDPLLAIFSEIYDKTQSGENKKLKLYHATYDSGQNLNESCGYLGTPVYSTVWQEKQAKRSVAATLQYIGLDTSIKAIGAYAKKLDVSQDNFKTLTNNLMKNYCSKNITIFSLRNIEKSLQYYYDNPQTNLIPSIESSPFATPQVKVSTEKPNARSKEFDLVIRNFRDFCSWGGDTEDYRMMTSYLNNRFIMSFVIKNMLGVQDKVDDKLQKVLTVESPDTVQVGCTDLICRKDNLQSFKLKFPLSAGSTGIETDLPKLYCHHFRFQNAPQKTTPEVKAWLKVEELEDPIFNTSQFISLMTGVPDFFNGVESYVDIPLLVRSSVDDRWNQWAKTVLNSFSRDLLYEESLKVKVEPRRDLAALGTEGFLIDFSITLGEMDRILKENDKLGLTFDLKLSKNYIRELRTKWGVLEREADFEGQKLFKEDIAKYINLQIKNKEKLFTQKLWNDDFSKLIGEELLQQALSYRGNMFDSYQDQVLRVPVKFSYGLFAIAYLRYRADVAAGRLKVSL
jgi:hypothetical protein